MNKYRSNEIAIYNNKYLVRIVEELYNPFADDETVYKSVFLNPLVRQSQVPEDLYINSTYLSKYKPKCP